MQEVVLKCDMPVGKDQHPCGTRAPDDEPTEFALEETTYSAHLCEAHREKLRECLVPFIAIATPETVKSGSRVRRALKGKQGTMTFTTKDVRKWMKEQGAEVPPSGRLPNEWIRKYEVAHAKK